MQKNPEFVTNAGNFSMGFKKSINAHESFFVHGQRPGIGRVECGDMAFFYSTCGLSTAWFDIYLSIAFVVVWRSCCSFLFYLQWIHPLLFIYKSPSKITVVNYARFLIERIFRIYPLFLFI